MESYGCTTNRGEGDDLARELSDLGHTPSNDADGADLVVLNTCTVVEATEKKMLRRMSELGASGKKVIVTGCMAKVQPNRISIRLPDAPIIPPSNYSSFAAVARDTFGTGHDALPFTYGTTAVLPISQGCSGTCTYCITKLARGGLRSHNPAELTEKFEKMVADGAREIFVTAQDAAGYGLDLGTDLPSLLKGFLKTPGDYRIRIGMSNPESVLFCLDGLVKTMADPRVYRFLHIPVQSGSDSVLGAMGRKYDADGYLRLADSLRESLPGISIATDVIAGFPGETEGDHLLTLDLLRRLKADTVNITGFSARPGTKAASLPKSVHGRIAKARTAELTAVKEEVCLANNLPLVGKRFTALVTEKGKPGTYITRTDNYRPVAVVGDVSMGTFLEIEVTGAEPTHLFGKVVGTEQN